MCYIGIVYRVRQQNKKSIAANQKEKLKRIRNLKVPTPPNSPIESRKILSSLEVDMAIDPSPLAFAPWSLKYLAKKHTKNDNNPDENRTTSLKISIRDNERKQIQFSQNIQSTNSECTKSPVATEATNLEDLSSIPTLSIVVEESSKSEKGKEQNEIVQVEVHRQDVTHSDIGNDEHKTWHTLNNPGDLSENKDYLKLPSVLFG